MKKLMTTLATERLKEQVMNLEIQQGIVQRSHPVVLPDADCYLYKLKQVKNLIQSQTCIVVVSLDVIRQLDVLKKGQDKVNISAREANRYLEQRFKFPSPFLVGQKPNEELQPADASIFIPSTYKSIVSCAAFYSQATQQKVTIITDSEHLKGIARSLNMNACSLAQWDLQKTR
jgi:PIN domain